MVLPNVTLTRLLLALLLAAVTAVASAQEHPRRQNAAQSEQQRSEQQRPSEARDSVLRLLPADAVTEHTVDIPAGRLAYTATAGTLSLFDQSGERSAAIYYTSYIAKGGGTNRPITFAFNGGPGAASALVAALDKESEFAGRAIHEWTAQVFRDETGTLLSGQYRLMVRTEREKARERKKYDAVVVEPYTDDQIDEIEAQYAGEGPRGAQPRWWEDVHEGDEVGPMVKGPLTVTDIVCWHAGMGMGLYGVKPLRLAYRNRARVPRFFHRDPLNVPDVMQRVHWDPEFARLAGNPTTFDYGRMRETWLIHLCTDWMGDDAWLWKLDCEFRCFNYVGDTQWLRGRVTRSYLAAGGRAAVDVELEAVNQRGELTTPGHATILLPSREHGPVRLPDPPGGARDLQGALHAISEEFGSEEGGRR